MALLLFIPEPSTLSVALRNAVQTIILRSRYSSHTHRFTPHGAGGASVHAVFVSLAIRAPPPIAGGGAFQCASILGFLLLLRAWRLHLAFEVLVVHEDNSSPLEVDGIRHLDKNGNNKNKTETMFCFAFYFISWFRKCRCSASFLVWLSLQPIAGVITVRVPLRIETDHWCGTKRVNTAVILPEIYPKFTRILVGPRMVDTYTGKSKSKNETDLFCAPVGAARAWQKITPHVTMGAFCLKTGRTYARARPTPPCGVGGGSC